MHDADTITQREIKELADAQGGPLVSIYFPTDAAGRNAQAGPIQLKNHLRMAQEALVNQGFDSQAAERILGPAQELMHNNDFWMHQAEGLALFLGEEWDMKVFRLPKRVEEKVAVCERFHVTPLLSLVGLNRRFYVLAVSEKNTHLLMGNRWNLRPIEVPGMPTNKQTALWGDDPEDRPMAGAEGGPSPSDNYGRNAQQGYTWGSGDIGDMERDKAEYVEFFHKVDKAICKFLRDSDAPVVLAGVEYVVSIYRQDNHYKNLTEEFIHGGHDRTAPDELHARAWEIVEPLLHEREKKARDRFEGLVGAGKGVTDVKEVVEGAFTGRVDTLFVPLGERLHGKYDPDKAVAEIYDEAGDSDEDLLNAVALETLQKGGEVYAVDRESVPGGGMVAAVMRY